MLLDIYKRPENHGDYSYLAVPSGNMIPEEVNNTDWLSDLKGFEVSDEANMVEGLTIKQVHEQITEKGYAISSVYDRIDIGSGDI
jgi:hypothetical protein